MDTGATAMDSERRIICVSVSVYNDNDGDMILKKVEDVSRNGCRWR